MNSKMALSRRRFPAAAKHVAVHEPVKMSRCGWCEPKIMAERIKRDQTRTIVNLSAPGEMAEARREGGRDAGRNAGTKPVGLSIPLIVVPADPEPKAFGDLLADPNARPTRVRRQSAATRTDTNLARYDVAFRGQTAEQALVAPPLSGGERRHLPVVAFPQQFGRDRQKREPDAGLKKLTVVKAEVLR